MASFRTTRFEVIPTPRTLHPDSRVDERMEEDDDDVLVDSFQGVGATPVIPEEPIDEGGLPQKELQELSHPGQELHNAAKAKATEALHMLSTGSVEIGERTGTDIPAETATTTLLHCSRVWLASRSWKERSNAIPSS